MKITNDYSIIHKFAQENKSIIHGNIPVCKGLDNQEIIIKGHGGTIHSDKFLIDIVSTPGQDRHIDVVPGKFTMEFNLGDEPVEVDRILFIGFSTGGVYDYSLHEFDFYFSTDGDTFNEKNHFYHYVCDKEFKPGYTRTTSDVMIEFDKPVKATTFGWKVSEFCPTDDCARLGHLALYSEEYSRIHSLLPNRYLQNTLESKNININGDFEGYISALVDNKAFDSNFVSAQDVQITIHNQKPTDTQMLYVAYEGNSDSIIYNGNIIEAEKIKDNYYIAECEIKKTDNIEFNTQGSAKLYEIGICDKCKEIIISDEVINDNFYGVGVNCMPMAMMEESMAQGYTYTHWEEERRRIKLVRPTVARMWFQPDWFIKDKESYYNLDFDYETPKMKCFLAYLDAFKEAGTEIELDYGWKNAPFIQEWYEIPGVRDAGWSAPRDIEQHGKACAKFLDDLINGMGYTNVKYLTFYNEICHRPDCGDFQTGPMKEAVIEKPTEFRMKDIDMDQFNYWLRMVENVKEELKNRGISDIVEFWGPEAGGTSAENDWMKEIAENHPDLISNFTVHEYHTNAADFKYITPPLMNNKIGLPVGITEFSVGQAAKYWDMSVISMIINATNLRYSTLLLWLISSVIKTQPFVFKVTGPDGDMWDIVNVEPDRVNHFFYDVCLFMRYVPAHSKVLKTETLTKSGKNALPNWEGEMVEFDDTELRSATYLTPNNDLVIAVEAKGLGRNRTLKIKLPDGEKRTFYKFSVGAKYDLSVPPMIPACEKVIDAAGNLIDDIDGDYQLIIYTTAKPYEQIICDKGYVELKKGETFDITYKLYDTDARDVKISVTKGEYAVSVEGNKIIAKSEGLAAVKVELTDSEEKSYDIILVKVN